MAGKKGPVSRKQAHPSPAKHKIVKPPQRKAAPGPAKSTTGKPNPKPKPVKHPKPKPVPKPVKQPKPTPSPSPAPPPSAPGAPIAKGSIEHVVIILKENHTFDSYFGTFPGANGMSGLTHASDPPTGTFSNNHAAWLARATKAVREQYLQGDVAAYWAYAQQFTLCDNFYTDVASDSTPNHLMLIAADSPVINNPSFGSTPSYNIPSLPANLSAAGITWRNYGGYVFPYITALKGSPNSVTAEQFAIDAAAGNLPAVSWVYPPNLQSEHPYDNVAFGMQWTVEQVNAVVQGGLWNKTAIFINWDDWGGWYDHVTPPNIEAWSDGTQFRYGSRVPCLVLSAFAKAGYISKVLHSFVSIAKFVEENAGVPSINQRDGLADNMADCFNFTQTPLAPPK
jgi:phospholipase C